MDANYFKGLIVGVLKDAGSVRDVLVMSILMNIDLFDSRCDHGVLHIEIGDRLLILGLDETCQFAYQPESKRLLGLHNIKTLFDIYEQKNGRDEYYEKMWNESCIRFIKQVI